MRIVQWAASNKSRRPTNLDGQPNRCTKSSEPIDRRVGAEEVDLPAEEIADPRLHHAQSLGGSPLLEATSREKLLYLKHEVPMPRGPRLFPAIHG
jgi:hypothetical protein